MTHHRPSTYRTPFDLNPDLRIHPRPIRNRLRHRASASCLSLVVSAVAAPAAHGSDAEIDSRLREARDKVFPAVVQIDVHAKSFDDGKKEIQRRTGSGVIINAEGYILTNFHVAHQAEKLIVTLINKERVHSTLIGTDHWTDLALLKLDPEELKRKCDKLHWAELGDSTQMMIGEPVLAMGTPFGLSRTMTAGIITNNERYFSGDSIDGYETGDYNNWLQTDAAINPGNSGGPLVNLRGEVIGINTRGNQMGDGLGFAVPISVAKEVVRQLLAQQSVTRSYLGLQLKELVDLEGHFGLQANHGVLVESVELSSPAREAGIQEEDVLLSINGEKVSARFPEELPSIRRMVADEPIGAEITLAVKRRDKELTFKVKTVRLESQIAEDEAEFKEWGVTVRSVTSAHARSEKLPDTHGVVVTGTVTASPSREAGLANGDIIRSVNRTAVTDLASFQKLYDDSQEKKEKRVLLEVMRGVTQRILVLKLEDNDG